MAGARSVKGLTRSMKALKRFGANSALSSGSFMNSLAHNVFPDYVRPYMDIRFIGSLMKKQEKISAPVPLIKHFNVSLKLLSRSPYPKKDDIS